MDLEASRGVKTLNHKPQKSMSPSIGNFINRLNPYAPRGLIDRAEDWVKQYCLRDDIRASRPSAWCRKFEGETEVFFYDPNLRSVSDFHELHNVRWTVTPESKLFYISNARILGSEAAVISPDNRVFREFNYPLEYPPDSNWSTHSCFKRRLIPPIHELKGWYATITYPASQFYFHWMLESLPRMRLLHDYIDMLDGVIVPNSPLPFHKQSLAILGIPEKKLIPVGPNTHFRAEHLFVPHCGSYYNPASWMHGWYKDAIFGPADRRVEPKGIKLYVSRSDANVRRLTNELEIIEHLEPLGFVTASLSDKPFSEQAQLFFDADVIVAPHGAGLANLVFCRPGTKVLEIMPPNWMSPCYFILAKSAGLRYSYLIANESVNEFAGKSAQSRDVAVPLSRFRESVLRLMEAL